MPVPMTPDHLTAGPQTEKLRISRGSPRSLNRPGHARRTARCPLWPLWPLAIAGGNADSSIKNLGPATEAAFAKAGIHSAEELRAQGADAAYARLLQSGSNPHFIGYYVLVMALQGRPWNDCKGAEKAALRKRFDEIKAGSAVQGQSELEKALNFLGVIEKRA
jgi:DNA transformation protein and related proteins